MHREKNFHINENSTSPTICLSGAFDPIHAGHVRMIKGASYFGRIIVILNSDEWTKKRKGYTLITWRERKEILLAMKGVSEVVEVDDSDGTVCEALLRIQPTVFGNGGMRTDKNTPERNLCLEHGIKLVYGLGGGARDEFTSKLKDKIKNIK